MADKNYQLQIEVLAKDMASKALGGIGKAIAGVAVAAGGIAAIVGAGKMLKDFGEMAAEEAVGIQKLQKAVENTGANWEEAAEGIETYLAAQTKRIALDDGEGRAVLQSLTEITGDYKKSMDLLPLAADLAAAKGMDLASASQLVGRVAAGNTGILARYGIVLKKGASATEALAAMTQKFGGQAEEFAKSYQGQMQIFNIQFNNLKETIGGAVLPIMTKVATALADLATKAIPVVERAIAKLMPVFNAVGVAGQAVIDVLRGTGGDIPWEDMLPPWAVGAAYAISGAFAGLKAGIDSFKLTIQMGGGVWDALNNGISTFLENIGASEGVLTFVRDAFYEVGEIVRKLGAGFSEAAKLLGKGDFIGAFKKVSETLRGFGKDVLAALGTIDWKGIWDTVKTAAADAIGKAGDFVSKAWPKVKAWFEDTAEEVKNKVKEIDWKETWERIKTALTDVAGTVGDFATKAWEKIKAWFTAAATEVGNKVSSIDWKAVWDKVKTALVDAVAKVSDAATAIGEKIGQWFEDAKIKAQEIITGMDMTGVSAGTRDRITQVMAAEKIEAIGQAISDWIVNGGKWLEENLTPVLNQFATTVTALAKQLQTEQGKENSPVSNAFGNAFVAILKASWSVLSSKVLWEAFWNVFLAQLALTETIKQRIRDKVLEIGHNIVEGIVSGIEAKVDELVTSIEDTVNKIPEIAKKLLGIASPSKVMITIGQDIMGGLVIGIESEGEEAVEAFRSVINDLTEVLKDLAGAANKMAGAEIPQNIGQWKQAIIDMVTMRFTTRRMRHSRPPRECATA
jgi:hypothetical protein